MQKEVQKVSLKGVPLAFLCLVLAAACADKKPPIGSTSRNICNCDHTPPPCCCLSPILLDVAGDGFRLTSWEDGVKVASRSGNERTERAWTEANSDDAWLVLDRNGDGVINDISELFGNTTPQPEPPDGQRGNGFLALRPYDANGDGTIDQQDPVFAALRLWQDKNHDGQSQPEELHTLTELGVAGLSLAYSEKRHADEHGNLYQYAAAVYGTPGSTVGPEAADVWLTGVQPMPLGGDKMTSPDSVEALTSYYACTAICYSDPSSCQTVSGAKSGPVDQADALRYEMEMECRDLVQNTYCDLPLVNIHTWCVVPPEDELDVTCFAECASVRNAVLSDPCPGTISVVGTNPSDEDLARDQAISGCLFQADAGFCHARYLPSQNNWDYTVTCQYHRPITGCGDQ